MSRSAQPGARTALALISLAVALGAGEILTARLAPRVRVYSELLEGEPYPAAYSDYLPLTTPAGVTFRHVVEGREIEYGFNAQGFRGPHPKSRSRPPDRRRLLVIGDSFVLGWGNPLSDTFVDLLRERLEPARWEVINAGYRGGYSPDGYYAYLRREGRELEPDLVVIALYTGNDLTDMRYNLWRRTDNLGAPIELGTIRLYMNHQGRLLHPAERLREILPWGYRVPGARQSHLFAAATQALDRSLGRNRLSPAEAERRFARVAAATRQRLAEESTPLVFLLIPPDPRRATEDDARAGRVIAAALADDSNVIDLAPRLTESAYFDDDAHFNARGNRIAYDELAEGLERLGLLGLEPPSQESGS